MIIQKIYNVKKENLLIKNLIPKSNFIFYYSSFYNILIYISEDITITHIIS